MKTYPSCVPWRFATEANRERFAAEPERFAPRYALGDENWPTLVDEG